jgi:hypothetical protein
MGPASIMRGLPHLARPLVCWGASHQANMQVRMYLHLVVELGEEEEEEEEDVS